MLLLIFLIGFLSIYINTSYGLFKKKDYLTSIDFVAGTLDYKIDNSKLVNNSITVESGEKITLVLDVTSLNSIDSKYELYYLIDGEKKENSDIEIGYTNESIDSVKGTVTANSSKKVTVIIKNNGDKSVNITFGCEGGLINNELIMVKGNSLDTLIVDGDIMLAYTYTGDNKPSKFPSINDGYYVTDLTCKGGKAVWDNDTWTMKITETSGQSISCTATVVDVYKDNSGASVPVIKGDLIPVIISDSGSVTKASLGENWYDYDESIWANAVILNDGYGPYNDGVTIPEEAIESYFVWIPRYKYKIFDEGNYTSLTTRQNKEQEIEIVFENRYTEPSYGSTLGTWLTHPAFTSFDSNGMWVGKFESGYRDATSTSAAQQDIADSSKLIVKPNVYSWRSITVGNSFRVCYDYKRELDSHMMKNTEWGAVAYLSHSKYGYVGKVRTNNNSHFVTGYSSIEEPTGSYNAGSSVNGNRIEGVKPGIDGTYTINYLNTSSVISSTTNNYSGIYDMAGGASEYVMGNSNSTTASSNITSLYSDFFINNKWQKYYDRYTSNSKTAFSYRILGDATGELGPFQNVRDADGTNTRPRSSWYNGWAKFIVNNEWIDRGHSYKGGISATIFYFYSFTGGTSSDFSFRVVLTPQ